MAETLYRMLWFWLLCCIVTIAVSLLTKARTTLSSAASSLAARPLSERKYPLVERPSSGESQRSLSSCGCNGPLDRGQHVQKL
jgi:hypothetical protein